jgi:hypothetical protein
MENQYPTTGYTPTPEKKCARCSSVVECTLYELCDTCHEADAHAADEADFRDWIYTNEINRNF